MDQPAGARVEPLATKKCPTCRETYPQVESVCPADGSMLVYKLHDDETLVGRTVDGRYRVDKLMAEGGMGRVYVARQLSVDRPVALKVLRRSIASDVQSVQRFQNEARSASQLKSPHTVTVFDFGQEPSGLLYLAMELVEGRSLYQLVQQDGPLSCERAVPLACQILESLAEAHDKGIIHRDIKPDNVLVTTTHTGQEWAKVTDFGIAKVTADKRTNVTTTGVVVGTPRYVSPEQIRGVALDARSDLYSLAVVLYELLAGAPPFVDDAPVTLLLRHLNDAPRPLHEVCASVPRELSAIVHRVLSKDREERPKSARELRSQLLLIRDFGGNRTLTTPQSPRALTGDTVAGPTPLPKAGAPAGEEATRVMGARAQATPPGPQGEERTGFFDIGDERPARRRPVAVATPSPQPAAVGPSRRAHRAASPAPAPAAAPPGRVPIEPVAPVGPGPVSGFEETAIGVPAHEPASAAPRAAPTGPPTPRAMPAASAPAPEATANLPAARALRGAAPSHAAPRARGRSLGLLLAVFAGVAVVVALAAAILSKRNQGSTAPVQPAPAGAATSPADPPPSVEAPSRAADPAEARTTPASANAPAERLEVAPALAGEPEATAAAANHDVAAAVAPEPVGGPGADLPEPAEVPAVDPPPAEAPLHAAEAEAVQPAVAGATSTAPAEAEAVQPAIAGATATAPAAEAAAPAVEVAPAERHVRLVTEPPGAKVIVAGEAVGETPYDAVVGASPLKVVLRLDGFADAKRTIEPGSPDELVVALRPRAPREQKSGTRPQDVGSDAPKQPKTYTVPYLD